MADSNESPFKEGDEVQHKTGGPKMIYVGKHHMTGSAICNWMSNGHKESDTFSFAELKPYVEPAAWSGRTQRT